MKTAFALAVTLLAAADVGFSADLPPLEFPQGVGVNIHFTTGHERDLDLIAAAGIKVVRMDFGWESTERQRGQYDWSAYDALTDGLARRGLRPLYILDYTHSLYESRAASTNPITHQPEPGAVRSPQTPESVAAFARWAAAAAKHFQGRGVLWEIYNEPNIFFWRPKPEANQYATLALATAKAVREADPQATILAPASSEFPWEFLETIFRAGLLEHIDAVSVHPYRPPSRGPETAASDYAKLRLLMDRHAPEAKRGKLPIVSGEWGYTTFTRGATLEQQAAYVARQQLSNLQQGIPISVWYDWKNDGPDANEGEHNFGLVYADLKPKPSYLALQTLTRELPGYRFARRLESTNTAQFLLVLTNAAGHAKLTAWATAGTHTAAVPLTDAGPATLPSTNVLGAALTLTATDGQLIVPLDALPRIVALPPGFK